jgi:hypothetical protein
MLAPFMIASPLPINAQPGWGLAPKPPKIDGLVK